MLLRKHTHSVVPTNHVLVPVHVSVRGTMYATKTNSAVALNTKTATAAAPSSIRSTTVDNTQLCGLVAIATPSPPRTNCSVSHLLHFVCPLLVSFRVGDRLSLLNANARALSEGPNSQTWHAMEWSCPAIKAWKCKHDDCFWLRFVSQKTRPSELPNAPPPSIVLHGHGFNRSLHLRWLCLNFDLARNNPF